MRIIRNDARIKKLRMLTQAINIGGLLVLGIGMLLSFTSNTQYLMIQWITLLIGIAMWQLSLNLSYRYVRSPRPDQSLDQGLKAALPTSHLYHYVLPTSHVLLTRSGPIVFLPLVQSGHFQVSGENGDKWHWKGPILRRITGQDPRLGNPTKEIEAEVGKLVNYLKQNAPDLPELPIGAILVFTHPQATLDADQSRLPAVHLRDLKKLIRKVTGKPIAKEQYTQLYNLFEKSAEGLTSSNDEAPSPQNS